MKKIQLSIWRWKYNVPYLQVEDSLKPPVAFSRLGRQPLNSLCFYTFLILWRKKLPSPLEVSLISGRRFDFSQQINKSNYQGVKTPASCIKYLAWSAAFLTFRELVRKIDNLTFCKVFSENLTKCEEISPFVRCKKRNWSS